MKNKRTIRLQATALPKLSPKQLKKIKGGGDTVIVTDLPNL